MNPTARATPPPPPPLAGTVPEAATAQTKRGIGTRSRGDLLAYWRAWALLVVLAAGVLWGAVRLVLAGAPWLDTLFWAAVLLGVLGVGAVWLWHKGPGADLWQLRAIRDLNAATLDAYRAGHAEIRATSQEWSAAYNVPPPPPKAAPAPERNYVKDALAKAEHADAQAADVARAFAALAAKAEHALTQIERFRVTPPPEHDTATLPPWAPLPDPPPTDYVGSDRELLMGRIFSGQPVGYSYVARLADKWTRARYEAARDSLIRAGVLIVPPGQGPRLAPAFAVACAGQAIDKQHELVETWLTRDGQTTQEGT